MKMELCGKCSKEFFYIGNCVIIIALGKSKSVQQTSRLFHIRNRKRDVYDTLYFTAAHAIEMNALNSSEVSPPPPCRCIIINAN